MPQTIAIRSKSMNVSPLVADTTADIGNASEQRLLLGENAGCNRAGDGG
jgi:hypothetical protein